MKLSELFNKYGSDKHTAHNYGDVYDTLAEPDTMLEIGVWRGQSARAFMDCWWGVHYIGVDADTMYVDGVEMIRTITPDFEPVVKYLKDNSIKLDLIVDDGSHKEECQCAGLDALLPFLTPGGVYIVEDITNNEIAHRLSQRYGLTIMDFTHLNANVDSRLGILHK